MSVEWEREGSGEEPRMFCPNPCEAPVLPSSPHSGLQGARCSGLTGLLCLGRCWVSGNAHGLMLWKCMWIPSPGQTCGL